MTQQPFPQSRPMMSFPQAVKTCLRKYAVFSGRATRAEFWWWVLATVIGSFIFAFVDSFVGVLLQEGEAGISFSFLRVIFNLAIFLPGLAVAARRLHDIGKTGWWVLLWYGILFLSWIPVAIGFFVLFLAASAISSTTSGQWFDGVLQGDFEISALEPVIAGLVVLAVALPIFLAVTLGVLIWSIIWLVRQGQPGPNRYGPDPRAPDPAE